MKKGEKYYVVIFRSLALGLSVKKELKKISVNVDETTTFTKNTFSFKK